MRQSSPRMVLIGSEREQSIRVDAEFPILCAPNCVHLDKTSSQCSLNCTGLHKFTLISKKISKGTVFLRHKYCITAEQKHWEVCLGLGIKLLNGKEQ